MFLVIACFASETVSGQIVTIISGLSVTLLEHTPRSSVSLVTFKMTVKFKIEVVISHNSFILHTSGCSS